MTFAMADIDREQSSVGQVGMTARTRMALALVLTCAVLTGPVGYAGQNGYAAMVGICGLLGLFVPRKWPTPLTGFLILTALAIWAVVSMAWSVGVPHHARFHRYKDFEGLTALKLLLEVALYGAFAVLAREVPDRWARWILTILVLSLGLITLLMVIDAFSGWAIYRTVRLSAHAAEQPDILLQRNAGRGCYSVALLFWPAAVWLTQKGWLAAAVLLGAGLVTASIGLHVDSPILALTLGGAAMLVVSLFGRPAIWTLLAATALYFMLTPAFFMIAGSHLPHFNVDHGVAKASWGARLDIWRFVARKVFERPLFGWGIDASRVWPDIPLHPHNAALQLWFELGLLGAMAGVIFWSQLWSRIGAIAEQSRMAAGVCSATAMAYLTIGGVSFGVWQEWWIALGVIAFIACDQLTKAAASVRERPGRAS